MENFLMKFCLYGLGIAGRLYSYFARYVYKRAGTDLFFGLSFFQALTFLIQVVKLVRAWSSLTGLTIQVIFLLQLSDCMMETCMLLAGVRIHEHW